MRKRWWALAAVAVAGIGAGAGVFVVVRDDDEESDGPIGTHTISRLPPPAAGSLQVELDGGAARTSDGSVDVAITAPAGATEVQVSLDPTFAGATWQPITEPLTIDVRDGGHQMVFARVRAGEGAEAGRQAVAGIEVDLTWDAATSSADGPHRPSWARMASPTTVLVRIEAGRVVRNGAAPFDRVVGEPLDVSSVDDPADWRVTTPGVTVASVSRVSRPWGEGITGDDPNADRVLPLVHDVYLELDARLPVGPHTIETADGTVAPVEVVYEPDSSRSAAIRVNQLGFAPADRGKVAFVSVWRGVAGGIDFPDAMTFEVVDTATRGVVLNGTTVTRATGDEFGRGDLTGAEVHEIDFSDVDAPGRYEVCVEALGCSAPFPIADDTTWRRALVAVARAAYHQRSGVALGAPYTSIARPRPVHPDDNVTFEEVSLTAIDDPSNIGRDDRYEEYPGAVTGVLVDDAWGGHFDAGDWNSRIEHLGYVSMALDLVRLFPDTFESLDLNIPESGDAVPDVLDEGLWDLDLYLRLQHEDGGVPGGVDQNRFGEGEETSWDNSANVYVYSPDPWSTYSYVAVAAQAAVVLEPYDAERAATYAASAEAGMAWAEAAWAELATSDPARRDALAVAVDRARGAAAAAMLELTRDPAWNDVLADATVFDESSVGLLDCPGAECLAAWLAARMPADLVEPTIRANATQSIVAHADAALAAQATTAFGWTQERPDVPTVWGLGPSLPHGVGVLRAFVLTEDARYREAMVRSASFSLGGNPLGISFFTGLGEEPVRHPLIIDAIASGLPVWPGTSVYGIHDLNFSDGDDWLEEFRLGPAGVEPAPSDTPLLFDFYDVGTLPMMNEFTYGRNHTVALWTMGVLAATG
ncbi:MAG: cellulase N-terminal Ig-like domain-containing protein [Actinomycetes bacterium]